MPVESSAQILSDISYLPLCGGLTILGLIATVLIYRRRGWLAGARMLAWALLPLALALVGAARALWQVISALLSFAFRLAFSPLHWVGAALLALCIVLFVVTSTISSRRLQRASLPGSSAPAVEPSARASRRSARPPAKVPAVAGQQKATGQSKVVATRPGADPEMDEIAEILKQRGIN